MMLIIPIFLPLICLVHILQAQGESLKVVYAINAGGYDHTDKNGIHYDADFLTEGIASDYGNHLLIIGRVPEQDEVLYKTERYHTSTFGYDLPLEGDGQYALILKFCEVYFNKPNKKIFDVILNRKHEIVSQLDIFAQVGRGTAHEEYVFFSVSNGKLHYKGQVSDLRNNAVRLDFIKGPYDNPKINAFVLFKGDVERIPRLKPLNNEAVNGDALAAESKTRKAIKKSTKSAEQQQQKQKLPPFEDDIIDILDDAEIAPPQQPMFDDDEEEDDDDEFSILLSKADSPRKPSGPRQPDPYSMDDCTVLLPVFVTIGAFIPLLFCLCKL